MIGLLLLSLLVLVAYSVFIEPQRLELTRYEIAVRDLPAEFEGFEFVHVTDTHTGRLGRRERRLLMLVATQMPKPILFTGDLPLRGLRTPALDLLRGLRALGEIWCVPGNHDKPNNGYGDFEPARHMVEQMQVTVLFNRAESFERGGARLWIAGVDDPDKGHPDLRAALHGIPEHEAVVLLAHSPDLVVHEGLDRVDVILCGHTHGGQVRIPGLGVVVTRLKRAPRRFAAGLHRLNPRATLFVSRGVGLSRLFPARFRCRPEVSVIRLKRRAD